MEVMRKATVEDAIDIASRLRPADRREALDFVGVSPSILLPRAARLDNTLVGLGAGGRPEAIWGVTPVIGEPLLGMVWAMATTALDTDLSTKIRFIRNSHQALNDLHSQFPALAAFVDDRNTLHKRWLQWTGFKVIKELPEWGVAKIPFLQVIKLKQD